ncbi:MAG: HWE histidine kinase domain-containing protein, partial [Sphingomonadaceae bacterium]
MTRPLSMAGRRGGRLGPPAGRRRGCAEAEIVRLRAALERQELISRELAHRNRNLFLVASGILMLWAQGDAARRALADALRPRFEALARAQAYLVPAQPSGRNATLHRLLEALFAPWSQPGQPRIVLSGADHPVGAMAATSLALLFHELATNALKHGALSRPEGRVLVHCQCDTAQLDL